MNYTTGTITLANGSNTVTGTGTGWQAAVIAGGVIYPQAAGNPLPIASVDSNTEITAATAWVGASGTYPYALQRQDDGRQTVANAAALADYIQRLNNPAISAIAGLSPEADKLPYFNGEGSAALTALTPYGRSMISAGNASTALTTLGVSAFARSLLEDEDAATVRTTLGAQAALGFTPVQQGTGASQIPGSSVKIGWSNAGVLRLQVDSTDFANVWPISVSGNSAHAATATNADKVGGVEAGNLARLDAANRIVWGPNAYWFGSAGGGRMAMSSGNSVEFHWNSGFYYRIDGNTFVLINSSASDARFKKLIEEGEIAGALDILDDLSPVRWEPKDDIPVYLPQGQRLGFLAQDLQAIDPAFVRETPIPGAGEDAEQQTYLALADDAEMQLIAYLWRAVRALSDRVAELEAASSPEA